MAKTHATGTEAISDPVDAEEGLKKVQGLMEDQLTIGEDDVMEWDEIKANFWEHGIDMDAADDLQDFSEKDTEVAIIAQGQENQIQETEEQIVTEEEKGYVVGEGVKKQENRKRLCKTIASTAVSTKMRIANALASPRKRVAAKISTRHGDNSKKPESTVSSNQHLDHQKT